ncbi:MauE/DoxX family redox-associated membrane protein [Micromonospora sp. NBC_00617]|uniref:MauE/DoxX family redox-associated membrane protein n=1 Tax=Micromonospora sp. NBC_00617 TaxID=2903587 RepID=UPI0038693B85
MTLSGVLAISVIGKVRNRESFNAFAEAITELQAASARWSRPVAAASIAAEIGVLTLVLWPASATVGLTAAVLLFAAFAIVLARAVRRGSTAGCHCFGPTNTPVAWRHVIRSAFLAGAAAGALPGAISLPTVSPAILEPSQFLVAVAIAVFVATALVRLDDLTWLIRGVPHAR